ncbi:MAG: long-chain-fatty-acid--CoA ligase, partial [Rhizobiaceae bacterium]
NPDHVATIFHGASLSFRELNDHVEKLAGYLQNRTGVKKGDRVLLYMQNSPQFIIGYYAILRANAIVVPVNPMNRQDELEYLAKDTGAKIALAGSELLPFIQPLCESGKLELVIAAAYADMVEPSYDLPLPDSLAKLTDDGLAGTGILPWREVIAANESPSPITCGPDDLAVIPYSSGTTGQPKGCMHTHRSVMVTLIGGVVWRPPDNEDTSLANLPMFHVTGMQAVMNAPIYCGTTVIIMTRWNRELAAELIKRYKVTRWTSITTMAIDLINDPKLDSYDLSSLTLIGGGGAAMPEAIATRLKEMTGLDYIEGYGLSETLAATHINPLTAPKKQCLGIPVFDVDARILSLDDDRELGPNEPGEIVMNAPQVFQGYWNNEEATKAAFTEIDGKPFFRTGDIAYYDENGYFFMVDRLKRMINASGFKVWPAEVEALMHNNPDIADVCIIGVTSLRRGETVKAVIVPQAATRNDVTKDSIIVWCKEHMAAYKCPTEVSFVEQLPKSGAGKILWRVLTEQETAKTAKMET